MPDLGSAADAYPPGVVCPCCGAPIEAYPCQFCTANAPGAPVGHAGRPGCGRCETAATRGSRVAAIINAAGPIPSWEEGVARLLAKLPRLYAFDSLAGLTINDFRVIEMLADYYRSVPGPDHICGPDTCGEDFGYERGRTEMLDRVTTIASQFRADFPADKPAGARASFADYLRINRADLLGGTDA